MSADRKPTFAERMTKYVGKPFKKGGHDDRGYDCIGLIHRYCADEGHPLPDEFEGWTLESGPELFAKDPEAAGRILERLFKTIGEPVDPLRVVAGDLVLVRDMKDHLFPAIYTGNRHAVGAFIRRGVHGATLQDDTAVVAARRIR